jgi:hypothetical protein
MTNENVLTTEEILADPEFPKVVYKYRDWNNPNHRKILTESKIYYAKPSSFNEPTECHLERDYNSVTETDILDYCRYRAKLEGFVDSNENEKQAQYLFSINRFHDIDNRKKSEIEFRKELNKMLSVFCTSEVKDNKRLWEAFGANHKGFCVGIDTLEMFIDEELFGSAGRVKYYDKKNPPKISPITIPPNSVSDKMMQIIYSLPDKFNEEQEFRFAKSFIPNQEVQISDRSIVEVILGANMDKEIEYEIIETTKSRLKNAKVYKAKFDFTLEYFAFEQLL